MRTLMLLIFLSILAMSCSTPIDARKWLINRPNEDKLLRDKRFNNEDNGGVKGGAKPSHPAPSLRKGEYLCAGKVCKLQPGEAPKHCNGDCQYPLRITV